MTALWTEACLAFPTLPSLRSGYEVYPQFLGNVGSSGS
jgi:hypothetical protein